MKKNNIALTALTALMVAGCGGDKDRVSFDTHLQCAQPALYLPAG